MSHLLFKAVEKSDKKSLLDLLDAGADIEYKHKGTGRTALLEASINGNYEAVELLLDRGANINQQCKAVGYSPLHWACNQGHAEIASFLIKRGAQIDVASTELSRTALMSAAQAGHEKIVDLLLKAGADAHLLDFQKRNAWYLANENKHLNVTKILEAISANILPEIEEKEFLIWPEIDFLNVGEALTDPVSVVRAFTLAMHAWEQKGNNLDFEYKEFTAEADVIRLNFCTIRKRVYKNNSYGDPTEYAPNDVLISCEKKTSTKAEVILQNSQDHGFPYEHCFLVKRVSGQWRIDSAKARMIGTKTWRNSIL